MLIPNDLKQTRRRIISEEVKQGLSERLHNPF